LEATPKPQDNKQRILQAAARLFAEHGYDRVSVREIAEQSDVTKPVIYYYFKNKKYLYETLIHEAFNQAFSIHEDIYHKDLPVEEKLRQLMKAHFDYCKKYPDIIKILYDTIHDRITEGPNRHISIQPELNLDIKNEDFRRIGDFIRLGQNKDVFRKDVAPHKVGMLFLGAMNMFIMYQLHSDDEVISDKVANELVDIILFGIMHTPEGDSQSSDSEEVVVS